jgi:hypothetical protein
MDRENSYVCVSLMTPSPAYTPSVKVEIRPHSLNKKKETPMGFPS